jgi:hypothetical protein
MLQTTVDDRGARGIRDHVLLLEALLQNGNQWSTNYVRSPANSSLASSSLRPSLSELFDLPLFLNCITTHIRLSSPLANLTFVSKRRSFHNDMASSLPSPPPHHSLAHNTLPVETIETLRSSVGQVLVAIEELQGLLSWGGEAGIVGWSVFR